MAEEKSLHDTMSILVGEYTEPNLLAGLIDRLETVLVKTPGAAHFFEVLDRVSFSPRKITIAKSQPTTFLVVVSLGTGIGMTLTVPTTALALINPSRAE